MKASVNAESLWRHEVIDTLVVAAVVIDLMLVTSTRMATAIRLNAIQAAILALLPLFVARSPWEPHILFVALAILVIRVLIMPPMLLWSIRHATVRREEGPLIGIGPSLLIAGLLVGISFLLGNRLRLPEELRFSSILVPGAFATILLGLFLLITRVQALTQVVAYLTIENGIYLFGLALVRETPVIVEMGILLDVFVGVFVMGIVIFHINRTLEHLDTSGMSQLRD
jgi:hydrogenase-4 component E